MENCKTVFLILWVFLVPDSKGCDKVQPLGVASNRKTIPDNQMSASSSYGQYVKRDYLTAKHGRVNSTLAWCAKTINGVDWLQVDMGKFYFVCGIETQGKQYGAIEWTTRYWVSMSRDGVTWKQYEEGGKVKVFQGNTDISSIVRHNFKSRVWTRYVRFYPTQFYKWPCLRVELYVQIFEPVILRHPQPSTIVAGDNLLLNCTAKGSPTPKITWKLNGNDVIFGRQLVNGSLWVEKVENDKNFEGKYGCIATNAGGSAKSNLVDVVIHEKPRILNLPTLHKSFVYQSVAVLSCYSIGDPPPTITWTKDGSTRMPRATIHDDGHVLVIPKVLDTDRGVYQCRAINDFGEAQSTIKVTVLGSPITINTLLTRKAIQTALMETVNMGCYGNSSLPLTYRWFKDNLPIAGNHGNNTVKVYENILVVTPKDVKDYGTYVCHVSNGVNSTEFEIELQQILAKFGPEHAQMKSHPNSTSKDAPLGIIVPLVVVLVLSIAVNILLIHRFYENKKSKKTLPPVILSGIATDDSTLIQSNDAPWDGLVCLSTRSPAHKESSSYQRF